MIPKIFIFLAAFMLIFSCQTTKNDQLALEFRDPPSYTRPWVYWYWIDENISREGITLDLEAMARAGIGRALIGHISPGSERGDTRILSEEWWEMVEHAVGEGQRLDVDIGFFNGPGWSQSGGPWIKPDQSMRYVVSNQLKVEGPGHFSGTLPHPDTLFQDIALLAFPAPEEKSSEDEISLENLSSSPAFPGADKLFDRDPTSAFPLPTDITGDKKLTLDLEYDNRHTFRSILFDFLPVPFKMDVEIQVVDGLPGKNQFITLRQFTLDRRNINFEIGPMRFQPATFSLPGSASDRFRIIFSNIIMNHGAGIKEIRLGPEAHLDQVIEKQLGKMYSDPLPPWDAYLWPYKTEPGANQVIDTGQVLNISSSIDSRGQIEWDIPEGQWIILRTGMVPTGATNVPVPPEATGFECDKFTREAIETHFNAYIEKFLKRVPESERKSLKTVVIDSYEVGPQNWTGEFREIFMEQYGYDPIPWLPVLSGNIIGSTDLSNRFLWDIRRLSADRIARVYVNRLREMSNENGLELWVENYGHWGFPAEFLQYGGQADQVSGEFWFQNTLWDLGPMECRAASSAAHTYGKNQVFAEAFTAGFSFRQYPAIMKPRGDEMFCHGINHMVLHLYIHQPWKDRKPGVNAWFGMSYQRHNTWFEQSQVWNEYFKRCHYLLQQGLPVSDICYYIGEDAPKMTGVLEPELPSGYDYDFVNTDFIMNKIQVKNGLLSLENNKEYKLLVLPPLETMRPEILKKIEELLLEGAVIYGPHPERSPSMQNYPASDKEVKELAKKLWGDPGDEKPVKRKIGKGRLFYGQDLTQVMNRLNIGPDLICSDPSIMWTHRKKDDTDIYFLSNQEDRQKTVDISFRVSERAPEFWDPATGRIKGSAIFRNADGRTDLPVTLDPFGSVFLVFRKQAGHPNVANIRQDETEVFPGGDQTGRREMIPEITYPEKGKLSLTTSMEGNYSLSMNNNKAFDVKVENIPGPVSIKGPWKVRFPEGWDVPGDTIFKELISWSDHIHPGIRHFSGTVIYNNTFNIPEDMIKPDLYFELDLGNVMVMADVTVNGRNLGIYWKKPFTLDITNVIKKGENELEVRITNTWWNRLIGDEKYAGDNPENVNYTPRTFVTHKAWSGNSDLMPAGLLGPVSINASKKILSIPTSP